MKILHACRETYAESRYGMGRANALLLEGLNHLDVRADYFCSSDLDASVQKQIEQQAKSLSSFCTAELRGLLRIIATAWHTGRVAAHVAITNHYTHVHCHDAVVAAGAHHVLRGHSISWGFSQHGFNCIAQALHHYVQPLPLWLRGVLWLWERRIAQKTDWIVCPTQLGCDNLARELRLVPDSRWHAIFHALPQLDFPEKQAARTALGWDAHLRYIVAVGQLIPLKRFELLIDAMVALPDDCQLVLLGDGDRTPYQERAARLGIAAPMMTSTDNVAPFLAAADIFVSASSTESFGMAVLEAMAAGLPVITARAGALEEVVADAAELAAPDAVDLVECLRRVVHDPARYAALVQKSRIRAAGWPDKLAIAQRYLAIYTAAQRTRTHAII